MSSIDLVMAREPLPEPDHPAVFLAGPTRRAGDPGRSWREDAVAELAAQWTGPGRLTVLSPESRGGRRAAHYDDQVGWETEARAAAAAILFWIPRDVVELPGFTTNVEFGLDVGTGRAVLGCPPDCPNPERNRYLIWVADRHGVPVCDTLHDTVAAALALAIGRAGHRVDAPARPTETGAAGDAAPISTVRAVEILADRVRAQGGPAAWVELSDVAELVARRLLTAVNTDRGRPLYDPREVDRAAEHHVDLIADRAEQRRARVAASAHPLQAAARLGISGAQFSEFAVDRGLVTGPDARYALADIDAVMEAPEVVRMRAEHQAED